MDKKNPLDFFKEPIPPKMIVIEHMPNENTPKKKRTWGRELTKADWISLTIVSTVMYFTRHGWHF